MHEKESSQYLQKLNNLRTELEIGLRSPVVEKFSKESFINEMHTKYKHLLLLKGK